VELSSNDAWLRDVGPTFVVNDSGDLRGVDWQFNAWGGLKGGLYFPWDLDEQVARKVLEMENTTRYRAPLVLEGGSIHVDGQGILVTTKECLLNPNRNPDLTQVEIEDYLREYLNVEKIIWIDEGVYMDETDGHVDNLCYFTRSCEIMLLWTDDREDPQYKISKAAYDLLSTSEDAKGRSLKIHKIHQPGPLYLTESEQEGLDCSETAHPRKAGDRLAGSLAFLMTLKNVKRGRVSEYANQYTQAVYTAVDPSADFNPLWNHKADCAFPSATQNEINGKDAQNIVSNGVKVVSEGANMPTVPEGIEIFLSNDMLYGPGKAANAGGVSVSGLEMTQNSMRLTWSREEVDNRLKMIMKSIHQSSLEAAGQYGHPGNYVVCANIAGFVKVVDAMIDQGIV